MRTRSPDRNTDSKLPASVITPTNLSLSNEQKKDKGVEISSLTDTRFCTLPKTLAAVLGSRVGNTLKYPSDEKRDLVQQVQCLIFGTWIEDGGLHDCVSRNVPPDARRFDPR